MMVNMDLIYIFLKTILGFLVQIFTLFIQLVIYVLNFVVSIVHSLANSV